jgi:hypothetical protein
LEIHQVARQIWHARKKIAAQPRKIFFYGAPISVRPPVLTVSVERLAGLPDATLPDYTPK